MTVDKANSGLHGNIQGHSGERTLTSKGKEAGNQEYFFQQGAGQVYRQKANILRHQRNFRHILKIDGIQ